VLNDVDSADVAIAVVDGRHADAVDDRAGAAVYSPPGVGRWCGVATGTGGGLWALDEFGIVALEPRIGGAPTVQLSFRHGRRDPYWDLDGRAARTERRHRRLVASTVVVLAVAILALVMLRLGSRDTTTLLSGPQSVVIVTSLAADAVACCLIFASASRRRASFRRYGEAV